MKKTVVALAGILSFFACAAVQAKTPGYKAGPNLLKNGDFSANNGVDAEHWTRMVQYGTNAVMRIVPVAKHRDVKQAVEMYFTSMERAVQTRYKQPVPFETNTVYVLEYMYQSGMDGSFNADVAMTGSGPMYRILRHIPSEKWTRVRRFFATPEKIHVTEGKIFLVQNRSMVPMRYANVSLRATDIPVGEVGHHQPSFSVHSVAADDQLILPGVKKETADFVIHTDAVKGKFRYEAFYLDSGNRVHPVTVKGLYCHVPMKAISEGKTNLYVAMKDGDVLVNWASVTIERIPDSAMPKGELLPAKPKCVRTPDGQPLLVIGMYCIDEDKKDWPMVELRRNGFNTLHSYWACGSWKKPEKLESLLERARINKMWWMVDIPHSLAEKPGNGPNLEKWFARFDKFRSVLFYYTDEMYAIRKTPKSLFDVTRKAMKTAAGAGRMWLGYEGPEKFLSSRLDGLLWNFSSPNMVKLARLRMGAETVLIHCFGQTHRSNLETPVDPRDIRYDFLMPVVLGARGVFYWENSTVKWRHKYRKELKEALFASAREFNALSSYILSEEPLADDAPKVSVDARDGSVYVLNRALGGKGVIIIARDRGASGNAFYSVNVGGYSLDSAASGALEPGDVVVLKAERK